MWVVRDINVLLSLENWMWALIRLKNFHLYEKFNFPHVTDEILQ